jgi:hypothetical protein
VLLASAAATSAAFAGVKNEISVCESDGHVYLLAFTRTRREGRVPAKIWSWRARSKSANRCRISTRFSLDSACVCTQRVHVSNCATSTARRFVVFYLHL